MIMLGMIVMVKMMMVMGGVMMMMMVEFLKVRYNDHLARYDDDQDEGRNCVEPQKPLHPHHDIRRNLAGKCFFDEEDGADEIRHRERQYEGKREPLIKETDVRLGD